MSPSPIIVQPKDVVQPAERRVRRRTASAPRTRRESNVRLWLPITPLFWMFAPFALLLAPLICLAPPLRGMNPYAAAWLLGDVLTSLSGTIVDVRTPEAVVRIRIL